MCCLPAKADLEQLGEILAQEPVSPATTSTVGGQGRGDLFRMSTDRQGRVELRFGATQSWPGQPTLRWDGSRSGTADGLWPDDADRALAVAEQATHQSADRVGRERCADLQHQQVQFAGACREDVDGVAVGDLKGDVNVRIVLSDLETMSAMRARVTSMAACCCSWLGCPVANQRPCGARQTLITTTRPPRSLHSCSAHSRATAPRAEVSTPTPISPIGWSCGTSLAGPRSPGNAQCRPGQLR